MSSGNAPHVLIGFDGSEAAEHAIAAAARLLPAARTTIVVVRESWLPLDSASAARIALPDSVIGPATMALDEELEHAAAELLERGRGVAAAAGLDAGAMVEIDRTPWRGLVAAAERHGAAAIVCGASGRGGLPRAVLGTTTGALLHHAPVPVLVVPGGEDDDGPLVIGYDRSDAAREAIEDAAVLFPGRKALVVHAWSSPVRRSVAGSWLLSTPVDEVQQLAASLDEMYGGDAEELAAEGAALARDAGLDAEPVVLESDRGVWRTIAALAEEREAAAIAVGSRGRGAMKAAILGSVSSGLVRVARRPVLVTRRATPSP
jgi:nucleotide-binding universal stress UspA family protein